MKKNNKITTTIRIAGMHCPSCDILIRTKLEGTQRITHVEPNHEKKMVTIEHVGTLSLDDINTILCEYGYKATNLDDVVVEKPFRDHLVEAFVITVILGVLYYLASELRLFPEKLVGSASSTGGAFVLGIIASASTCMATTGALFTAFIHKQDHRNTSVSRLGALFMIGRLASYAFFGFVLGYFGSGLSYVTQLGAALNIVIAFILIIAGLDMLKLVSLAQLLVYLPELGLPKKIPAFPFLKNISVRAVTLGAFTYFLPCGFTLSTQAYALGVGNPWFSSQIMLAFALGTIPSLIFLAALSRFRNAPAYQYILKSIGIVICVVGINYIISTIRLYDVPLLSGIIQTAQFDGTKAQLINGKQKVTMTVTSSGYTPNSFVIQKGIPVQWEIVGKDVYGCQGSLQSPQAGVKLTYLKEGENIVEFTPKELGTINFSCSMGMFSGQFKVVEKI